MNRYGKFLLGKRVQSSPGRPLLPVVHSLCLKSQLCGQLGSASTSGVLKKSWHDGMMAWRHGLLKQDTLMKMNTLGINAGKHTDIRHHGTVDQTWWNKMKVDLMIIIAATRIPSSSSPSMDLEWFEHVWTILVLTWAVFKRPSESNILLGSCWFS